MNTSIKTPPHDVPTSRWGSFIWLILLLVAAGNAMAGVLVAPTVVLLSDKNRTARLDINNPGSIPQEVTIGFAYGLPESDSDGNVRVMLQDSNVTDTRSAMQWIKAFPRQMIIPPNGSQVVRFVVNPPKDLKDGEYWARVVVRSKDGQQEIPPASTDGAITTKLNMVMQTAIMLKYRTGSLTSEVAVVKALARRTDTAVVVTIDLANKGNASYVGVLSCRLFGEDKKEIFQTQSDVAVYRELRRRFVLPLKAASGKYSVEVAVTTAGRTDIAPEDIIQGNKIFSTVEVE